MRVSMERIEKEGYNLNISRYISTAQTEEEIDLQAVNEELLSLAQSIEMQKRNTMPFSRSSVCPFCRNEL
jgi:type I restriction enzyme M protein